MTCTCIDMINLSYMHVRMYNVLCIMMLYNHAIIVKVVFVNSYIIFFMNTCK